jgi:hypothetical protein
MESPPEDQKEASAITEHPPQMVETDDGKLGYFEPSALDIYQDMMKDKNPAMTGAQILNGLRRSSRGDGTKPANSSLPVDPSKKRGAKEYRKMTDKGPTGSSFEGEPTAGEGH